MARSGVRPTGDRLFVQELEDLPQVQASQDQLVLAQVDSVGPDVKGIKAGSTILVRASSLASALAFNELRLLSGWDVVAIV